MGPWQQAEPGIETEDGLAGRQAETHSNGTLTGLCSWITISEKEFQVPESMVVIENEKTLLSMDSKDELNTHI